MSKRKRHAATEVDQAHIDATVANGGLAVYEREGGAVLHVAPPDVANSLRLFLSRLGQSGEVGFPPLMAITSAISGEGVTFVARSVAALIAHDLDRSVCVLETNWWSTPDSTAIDRRTGLADVLSGRCTVDEALVRTTDERFAVLTSGDLPVAARPAVVAGSAFTDVLKLLTKVFDAVVIDAPPVLKAPEATTVARHADAAILVVRHGVTTEQQVARAIDDLSGTELGVIVNRSSTRVPKLLRRFTPAT
jgi:Mrp family chromosome partitioning ATPase